MEKLKTTRKGNYSDNERVEQLITAVEKLSEKVNEIIDWIDSEKDQPL